MERIFQLLFLSFCMGFIVLALLSEPARAKDVKTDNLDAKLNEVLEKLDTMSCAISGYIDNMDGTVCDCTANLMWEKKTGTVGEPVDCDSTDECPDPHDVNNRYTWTADSDDDFTNPDGTVYTVFLAQLNEPGNCFASHCDWSIPQVNRPIGGAVEFETILDVTKGECGGGIGPCINPIFGPTASNDYWSSVTYDLIITAAWFVDFKFGSVSRDGKNTSRFARAVRPCE